MIAWGKFPFVRFAAAFMGGILFYSYIGNPFSLFFYLFPLAAALYVALAVKKADNLLAGLLAFCCTFSFGVALANLHNASYYKDNISYQQFSSYVADITSDVEDRGVFYKAEASIVKVKTAKGWQRASGKVLLYLFKDSLAPVVYGNWLLIKAAPQQVKAPLSPGEFDYKKYLAFQNIYHQQFLSSYQYQKLSHTGNLFLSWAFYLRHSCDNTLKAALSKKTYPVASALVLGIRNSLDDEVKQAYTSTGTIHVLAVSGLHIVVIYGALFFVFGFIKNLRGGDVLFTSVIFALLWLYAFITGFSPSVVRAVTMFSFVLLAQLINRKSNIYNTLALSAFIMLCFNPYLLMDAGFQLSYLAVLGIVLLYKPLYELVEFKNPVADKLWAMAVVSVAAQLTTVPLTMYYFNQLSFSFLLANFIAIPLSSLALFSSLGIIAFYWLAPLAALLAYSTELLITIMNQSVLLLNKIPYSSIKSVNINPAFAALLYLLIAAVLAFFSFKKFNYALLTALIVVALASFNLVNLWKIAHRKQVVVLNIKNHTAMALVKADRAILFADSSLLNNRKKMAQLGNLLSKMDISCVEHRTAEPKLIKWEGKTICMGSYDKDGTKPDFQILKTAIIIDSKNLYDLSTQGAYIKDL